MNDDDKIIICSGKSAALAIETAMIALGRRKQQQSVRLYHLLEDAKQSVETVVKEIGG